MLIIRDFRPGDEISICNIYNHYIRETVISFEEEPLTPAAMLQRVETVTETYPWLVATLDDELVGYAYANRWNTRSSYRATCESSIYLHKGHTGKGYGKTLFQALIARLRELPLHCVVSGIALPNEVSVRLHEYLGFEKVAHFRQVGNKFGNWVDVGYWELLLD